MSTGQPIGKIIPGVLKQAGLSKKKEKTLEGLEKDWGKIMGEHWASKTYPAGLKQNVLQVKVVSSVLLYELAHFQKTQILQKLRARYPERNFRDVNFRVGGTKGKEKQNDRSSNHD